ncbi:MAG TPA: DnaJ domain-containing protein, partial [Polyangia bacterium]
PAAAAGPATVDGLDLTVEQARRIDEFFVSLATRDAFELLEIARDADKKEVKRAYFKMSKELHPDRFFGKNIGPYRERLSKIFQSIKAAYELLSDDARRAAYLDSVE